MAPPDTRYPSPTRFPFQATAFWAASPGAFLARPNTSSCPMPVSLLPLPGVAGISGSGSQWAQRCPEFLFPAIRAGSLTSHCVVCRLTQVLHSAPASDALHSDSSSAVTCADAETEERPAVSERLRSAIDNVDRVLDYPVAPAHSTTRLRKSLKLWR